MNIAEADWATLNKEILIEHREYVLNNPDEFEDMYFEYLEDYIEMMEDNDE